MLLNFAAPQFLWLLAALPLVVALHYLRTRRLKHEVAALFLWQRAHQAVVRRRRFAPTWLLAAQLLFAALTALALAQPQLGVREPPDLVIIIDASASMAAVSNGRSRLSEAVAQAQPLALSAGRAGIIRAGLDARLLLPLDADQAARGAALATLQAGDAAAELSRALDLARSVLPAAEIHLFTDQALALGNATVHVVGGPVDNVGISALDIGIGQVFVALVASGNRPVEVPVSLWRDGVELASGNVLVPSGGAGSITFPIAETAGIIEARLQPPANDALDLDDVAYAGSRLVTVITDDAHGPLVRALAALTTAQSSFSRAARLLDADLKILSSSRPDDLGPGRYLLFAPPAAQPNYQIVREWDRAHPLLRFVDLREAVVGIDPTAEAWTEDPGWQVLARTADLTPVLRLRQRDDQWVLQAAFHTSQTDLVLRPAFPALMVNVVAALDATARIRLGEGLPAALEPGTTAPVLEPGVYRPAVDPGPGADRETAVLASLLSASETRLPPVGSLIGLGAALPDLTTDQLSDLGAGEAATAPAPLLGPGLALLPAILLTLALLALAIEWFMFGGLRAPRGQARQRPGRPPRGGEVRIDSGRSV